jgi:hypothetical protein
MSSDCRESVRVWPLQHRHITPNGVYFAKGPVWRAIRYRIKSQLLREAHQQTCEFQALTLVFIALIIGRS